MIPIFKPYMPQGLANELSENLYSGKLAFGENGKLFEKKVAQYIGTEKFISASSFNYAFLILLSALNLEPGDEIIASPVSCLASNQPFAIKKLNIKWVDIDPETGSIDVDDLKKKLSAKTKAVFVNYYCGYVGNCKEIYNAVKEYNIPLIDDSIEAFGSEYDNKRVGNLYADATVFSFQTVRLPNTIDGGGIAFNSDELYKKSILIRDYGIDRSSFRDENNEISAKCDIALEGYGALLSEINSIVGLKQMSEIENLFSIQRKNAAVWDSVTSTFSGLYPIKIVDKTIPNYWVYGVFAKNKTQAILKFRELGFYATSVHINNNVYSVFKNKTELKGVNEFMNHFIAIPCGWWLDNNLINNIKW